jgi:putative colanic acid biosynthesis UDP-glucose lipid carrier transferase
MKFAVPTLAWPHDGAEFVKLVTLWFLMSCIMAVYALAMRDGHETSRLWWGGWGLSIGGAMVLRVVVPLHAGPARRGSTRHLGGGRRQPDAQRLVDAIRGDEPVRHRGLRLVCHAADRSELTGAPMLGGIDNLGRFVESRGVDLVWLALPMRDQPRISYALSQLKHSTADIKLVPDLFGVHLLNHSVEEIAGLPVITLQQTIAGRGAPDQGCGGRGVVRTDSGSDLAFDARDLHCGQAQFPDLKAVLSARTCELEQQNVLMYKFRSMPVTLKRRPAPSGQARESRSTRVGAFPQDELR